MQYVLRKMKSARKSRKSRKSKSRSRSVRANASRVMNQIVTKASCKPQTIAASSVPKPSFFGRSKSTPGQ
jgi:hypothetical protein